PRTAVHVFADAVGTHLAGQVHFDRTVYGGGFRILTDDGSVVGIVNFQHSQSGVVVHEVVKFLRAQGERADDFSTMLLFVFPRDDTLLHQRDHTIGKHFGMYTQVFMVVQCSQNGVGNTSDTQLKRGAVFDKRGNVLAYFLLDRCDGPRIVSI